jgi:hypothetical protein
MACSPSAETSFGWTVVMRLFCPWRATPIDRAESMVAIQAKVLSLVGEQGDYSFQSVRPFDFHPG